MAEESFPVIEKPLTDDQWKSVTLGIGDGILDEGGNPYNLTLSNQTDQGTVQIDGGRGYNHAILRGFYHRMDAPISLSLPAVSTKTTYTIALRYDPTDKEKPVRLGVYTTLDRSNGKAYLELWRIVRSPNQLLESAEKTAIAPHITPLLQFSRAANLPDPGTILFGTQAHCRYENVTYRCEGPNGWRPMTSVLRNPLRMSGWSWDGATGGLEIRPTTGGVICSIAGSWTRTAATYWVPTPWHTAGTLIPSGLRPSTHLFALGLAGDNPIIVSLTSTGNIDLRPGGGKGNQQISKGDKISFAFTWFVSTSPTTNY